MRSSSAGPPNPVIFSRNDASRIDADPAANHQSELAKNIAGVHHPDGGIEAAALAPDDPAVKVLRDNNMLLNRYEIPRSDVRTSLAGARASSVATPAIEPVVASEQPAPSERDVAYAFDLRIESWRDENNDVYCAVSGLELDRYWKQGAIRSYSPSDRPIRKIYFSTWFGKTFEEHCEMMKAALPVSTGEKFYLLKIPVSRLKGIESPEPEYGQTGARDKTYGRRILAYTTTFSEDWIIPWPEATPG